MSINSAWEFAHDDRRQREILMKNFYILGSAHVSMIVQGTNELAPGRFNGMVTLLTDEIGRASCRERV